MAGMSPSSSPRLPSPPPIAEDQLGPMSPLGIGPEEQSNASALANVDTGASRRIRPGTKAVDMADGPPLADLRDIESAFQLMEYLKALHYDATHPPDSIATVPITRDIATRLATPPEGVDRALWLYELCRFLTEHANSIVIALFADEPSCSAQTCPEMRASEWQYLCAVHDPPKSCCAIDYCCHTLDWAANTLTSPKNFPSRLALGTEKEKANQQIRQLTNVFRRVYRIFAHAWFQHRDMFWRVENKTGLYTFFKTVCDVYTLIPPDNYTIPPEAEGIDSTPIAPSQSPPVPVILKKDDKGEGANIEPAGNENIVTGNTTKRHRGTPSVSGPVTTVIEENEEEEDPSAIAAQRSGVRKDSNVAPDVVVEPAENTTTTGDTGAQRVVEVRDAAAEVHEAAQQGEVTLSEPSHAIVEDASVEPEEIAEPEPTEEVVESPKETGGESRAEEAPTEKAAETTTEATKEEGKAEAQADAEPMDPKESKAADAEEASKSVED